MKTEVFLSVSPQVKIDRAYFGPGGNQTRCSLCARVFEKGELRVRFSEGAYGSCAYFHPSCLYAELESWVEKTRELPTNPKEMTTG